jgi:hypothetical protein
VEKQAAALKDIAEYLSQEKFDQVTNECRTGTISYKDFYMSLAMFAGISGYPATAWYNHIYNLPAETEHQFPEIEIVHVSKEKEIA